METDQQQYVLVEREDGIKWWYDYRGAYIRIIRAGNREFSCLDYPVGSVLHVWVTIVKGTIQDEQAKSSEGH